MGPRLTRKKSDLEILRTETRFSVSLDPGVGKLDFTEPRKFVEKRKLQDDVRTIARSGDGIRLYALRSIDHLNFRVFSLNTLETMPREQLLDDFHSKEIDTKHGACMRYNHAPGLLYVLLPKIARLCVIDPRKPHPTRELKLSDGENKAICRAFCVDVEKQLIYALVEYLETDADDDEESQQRKAQKETEVEYDDDNGKGEKEEPSIERAPERDTEADEVRCVTICVISADTGDVVRQFQLISKKLSLVRRLAVDTERERLYMADGDNGLFYIDVFGQKPVKHKYKISAYDVAVDSGGMVYVADLNASVRVFRHDFALVGNYCKPPSQYQLRDLSVDYLSGHVSVLDQNGTLFCLERDTP